MLLSCFACILWRSFGRAGASVVPCVCVCVGYVGVGVVRGGGFVCHCFLWLLALVAAVVSSVSFGFVFVSVVAVVSFVSICFAWSKSVSAVSFVAVCLGWCWFKCWVLGAEKARRRKKRGATLAQI